MKKIVTIVIALAALLAVVSCGKEKGSLLVNNLGVDLVKVEVFNEKGETFLIPSGIANGDSATFYTNYPKKEGVVKIVGEDASGNRYEFDLAYVYDDTEITMIDVGEGKLRIDFEIEQGVWGQYDGKIVPAE